MAAPGARRPGARALIQTLGPPDNNAVIRCFLSRFADGQADASLCLGQGANGPAEPLAWRVHGVRTVIAMPLFSGGGRTPRLRVSPTEQVAKASSGRCAVRRALSGVRSIAWPTLLWGFGAEMRVACRRLVGAPTFTIVSMVSLALGVGITTATYSVVEARCWSTLGIPRSEGLVFVVRADTRFGPGLMSALDFEDLQSAQTSFSELTASAAIFPAVAAPLATELQPGEAVDGSYFPSMGIRPVIGRVIGPADESQAASVVVLSYRLWKSRFASDPHIVGQTVRLSGRPFEVVGVTPESFGGPVSNFGPWASRLWVPRSAAQWMLSGNRTTPSEREQRRLTVIGRLRPGLTELQAASELAAFGARLDAAYPQPKALTQPTETRRAWSARRLDALSRERTILRRFGTLVLGLVALMLLVACTNLANLVLARGTTRQHELAVRCALGAPRWRLVREQCAESALLAIGGAVLSVFVMQILVHALDIEIPINGAWVFSVQPQIKPMALIVAGGAVLLSLVVFGVEPAWQLARSKGVLEDLNVAAGSTTVPKARRQRTLLRWQVAISAGFFMIASLPIRYLAAEARHDSGVDIDRLGIAIVDFYQQGWDEGRARQGLQRILERAQRVPGVESLAVSTGLPFGTTIAPRVEISTTDRTLSQRADQQTAKLIAASPGFFRTTHISVVRGRGFEERDDSGSSRVIVLSQLTAKKLFGTVDAVGRELQMRVRGWQRDQPVMSAVVVGVAEETDTTHFFSRGEDVVYMPLAQEYYPVVTLVCRASNPETALGALRTALHHAEPDLAVTQAATGRAMLTGPYAFLRAVGVAAVLLGAITLLFAMVGLYGVQSHIVAHRTSEIGLRLSLGASAQQIKWMVLKDGYRPVLEGLAIGLFVGLAGRAVVRALVVAPMVVVDPWMLGLAPIALIVAAFWACYVPAHRASRVDPNVALRHM